jgi:hypothetical protein
MQILKENNENRPHKIAEYEDDMPGFNFIVDRT